VYIVDATAGQSSPLGRENGIFLAATRAGAPTHRSISLPFGLGPAGFLLLRQDFLDNMSLEGIQSGWREKVTKVLIIHDYSDDLKSIFITLNSKITRWKVETKP
jgi:hypothetical protein